MCTIKEKECKKLKKENCKGEANMQQHENTAIQAKKEDSLCNEQNKPTCSINKVIWNILKAGLSVITTIWVGLKMIASILYTKSCAEFYGMDSKYFTGSGSFEIKMIIALSLFFLFQSIFIFPKVNKKFNITTNIKIIEFIITSLILFIIIIMCIVSISNYIFPYRLKRYIGNWITLSILLFCDIVISYFVIFFDEFATKKYAKIIEKFSYIAMAIYTLTIVMGMVSILNNDISNKKRYEIIEDNKAVVSNYGDNLVLMNCELEDETLILKKGTYSIENLTGVSITYHEFDTVVCEYRVCDTFSVK